MSVFSWLGRKKKAKQEAETESAGTPAGDTAQSAGADGESGEAQGADGGAPAADESTAAAADAEKAPDGTAETPARAGVEIPRQQSAGDIEGSEAGEGARQ
ncbi:MULTISPECIES: hypothetical protein [Streptomyces]|uniref:Gliding motility protein n=1 Tax=Streptomyces tsukubensis (strain DSM 42081 / NBRC 108919 / NRRL 18488 / 9993) TaxID=1114943 RepID=A0A7G3UR24_STRT9|nr:MULTISPECIES: hypothetical protein [Streptomyces]MYS64587.1 hypothetical protein [Streptomyces sp. SID5473]QKM71460.1 hypothetical protein STSU_008010 [Streptomyces tsukubensis NRRL18488]TAI41395.1 hypothetical protein EWI31_26445 [Streptomyces tsukubensis]